MSTGGRFDFDDGGAYCGGWQQGQAHGRGVCTGPQGQGEYAGTWSHGYEALGVYSWPGGGQYQGSWAQGQRHGLGLEARARWEYRGEWTQGFKGRYGQLESRASGARYEGTWSNGLQDGYGTETYSDGGTFQGQWLSGMRHGYGIRQSVPYGMAAVILFPMRTSINSLRSEHSQGPAPPTAPGEGGPAAGSPAGRGGFALTAPGGADRQRKRKGRFRQSILSGLKLRRSESKSSLASQMSKQSSFCSSAASDLLSTASEGEPGAPSDATVTEAYAGEWRCDQRAGWGVCRRSDGLQYHGEWAGNRRHGYGCTTFPDGTKEEGKYKQNALVSGKRKNLIPLRASRTRDKVDRAVEAAEKAADIARQKAEIAMSRMSHARGKAEAAEAVALQAMDECRLARLAAKELSPSFHIVGKGLDRQPSPPLDTREAEHEVVSTGTESPELCTPPVTTPELSPAPAARPGPRPRNACFLRQGAVDHQGEAEIQVLVEGRGAELPGGGANRWVEEAGSTPHLEEEGGQVNGHQAPAANHRPGNPSLSNHNRQHSAHRSWDHSSSNQKPPKHASSNYKTQDHCSTNHKAPYNFKPQVHVVSNHKALEHNASNHKTAEHASSNHKSQDDACSNHNAKKLLSSGHAPRGHAHSNHRPEQSCRSSGSVGGARGDYTVDMRPPLGSPGNRLRARGPRTGREGSVQMLDQLSLGEGPEGEGAWPLHRDLTLSPPLTSQPITLEHDGEMLTHKTNHSGSSSILVAMVILLNIGVAILFIHFFI